MCIFWYANWERIQICKCYLYGDSLFHLCVCRCFLFCLLFFVFVFVTAFFSSESSVSVVNVFSSVVGLFGREKEREQHQQFIDSICVLFENRFFFCDLRLVRIGNSKCVFFSLVDFGYWLLFFVCSSFSHSRWVRIERQNWVDLLLLLILLLQILADSCVQTDVAKLLSKRHNCMCINEKVFYGLLFWSIVLFRCLIRSVFESAWTNNKLAKKRLSAKWKKIDNNINIRNSLATYKALFLYLSAHAYINTDTHQMASEQTEKKIESHTSLFTGCLIHT